MTDRLLHRRLRVGDFVRFDASNGAVPPTTQTVEGRVVGKACSTGVAWAVVAIAGPCQLYIDWDWLDSNRYGDAPKATPTGPEPPGAA